MLHALLAVQLEIKALLESVYGMSVEKVNTLNYEGKKKRTKSRVFQKADWKKAYVYFRPPQETTNEENGST